jgi:dynein heavy chain
LENIELPSVEIKDGLTEMCMRVAIDVASCCEKYYKELKRKVYTTPKSYLD